MTRLYDELKRRNVFRVAIAYLVAAWLILQIADLVLENTEAPAWVMQVFMLVFALGCPLVIIFSWAYELTPEGVKREKDVDRSKSVTPETGRKLDQITIVLLVIVVLFVSAQRWFFPAQAPDETAELTATAVPEKSIAVLAFEDLSAEGDQGYFTDGLSEELLNVLAQIPDLQVAGRTSSFAFKGQNRDLREIGEILNVAHILEGSVRKSGNRIRVTAQLVNASDGYHLFSTSYDRDLTDIFQLQDELAQKIGDILLAELSGGGGIPAATPTEIEVYELYLSARQLIHTRNGDNLAEASTMLDGALAVDPDYAPALAQKALVVYLLSDNLGSYGDIPIAEALAISRPLVDRALSLEPQLAEAHAVSGLIKASENAPIEEQIETLERALALNPNLDDASNWLSTAFNTALRFAESLSLLEQIVERDPLYPPAFQNLIQNYLRTRDFDKANALIGRVERITGETGDTDHAWGVVALSQGQAATAIRHYRRAFEEDPSSSILRVMYAISLMAIGEFETANEVGIAPMRIFTLTELGLIDEARSLLAQLPPVEENPVILDVATFFYHEMGEHGEVIAYMERDYGSLERVLELFPNTTSPGTGYMAPLAYAYRQLGRDEEAARVLEAMLVAVKLQTEAGLDFPGLYSLAEYEMLVGNQEAALDAIQGIVDIDLFSVGAFDTLIFEPLFENERFKELTSTMLEHANTERAKLGLDPYRPIAATN